jgi:ubiquinone/menaquinone biosynthesis C-methylase UbiE
MRCGQWLNWESHAAAGGNDAEGNHMTLFFCGPALHRCRKWPASAIASLAICAVLLSLAAAQDAPAKTRQAKRQPPQGLREYKGRRIAQTMHYSGAEWLTRDDREQEERCSLLLANLGVKRGMAICDMGCGNGFYTLQMAKGVGADGHIYAVDIQPEMLKMLNDRADSEGISNISPILGTYVDPRLPKAEIDLILLVDVYHEFSNPEEMLAEMREALAPGGVIVLVEYRAEDDKVPIKPEHKMSKAQIMKEYTANGFKLVKEFDKLPWQHMMWFGVDERGKSEGKTDEK